MNSSLHEIDKDLDRLIPPKYVKARKQPNKGRQTNSNQSSRQRRRTEYAKVQELFKKNKGKTIKGLLNNALLTDKEPLALEKLENFWKNLLKTPSTKDDRVSNEIGRASCRERV